MATRDKPKDLRQPSVPTTDTATPFLNASRVRLYDPKTGEAVDIYKPEVPVGSSRVSTVSPTPKPVDPAVNPTGPEKPGPVVIERDLVDLTDIENISFEEYEDPTTKIVKVRAYIKVRNGSLFPSDVQGVDVRLFDDTAENTVTKSATTIVYTNPSGSKFTRPTPTVPAVKFDRTGTAIAWGWNNVSGLGSYSSVYYEWIISKTSGKTATAIDSGTKEFSSTGNLQVGNSGVYKRYRVSSGQGDTAATSSPRWLRVRAVVVGTDGKKYYSEYSNPI